MADPNAQTKVDGLTLKVGNVPIAMQGTSLALILGVGGMVYTNFATLQDRVADTSASQAVLGQQMDAMQDKLSAIDSVVKEQELLRAERAQLAARVDLFIATTNMRLESLEKKRR